MKNVTPTTITDDPQIHEDLHVHAIYDQIAAHFSSTRYKPWPIIAQFLSTLPTGWIGLDSGTGNGKYLPLPAERPGSVLTIGLDRSRNLLQIAQHAGGEAQSNIITREVIWGDVLGNAWRPGAFDYAISIATIHHLASYERRKLAVQRLLQCVSSKHGRVLIYVWAIEQDELSKRKLPPSGQGQPSQNLARGCEPGQDVFVPWVLSQPNSTKHNTQNVEETAAPSVYEAKTGAAAPNSEVYNRYYHMFAKGELTQLTHDAARGLGLCIGSPDGFAEANLRGIDIVQDGWERSNYFVELRCWTT
ncbi:hypothetical protein BV22DRAFT_1034985 [Leucogyrophana mollusca]|uniref:Uncharacterized protein n=1 Tax=Leucogyrophana mollusca TaxID=85980 RepID=A0ACB8BJ64_9AGAM|nr:hypothetical protein BV22DRAFT_1034985 [Leucogyrophana mollusca]